MKNVLIASAAAVVLILSIAPAAHAQLGAPPMPGAEPFAMDKLIPPPMIDPDKHVMDDIRDSLHTITKMLRRMNRLMDEDLESRDMNELSIIVNDISLSMKEISEIMSNVKQGDMETLLIRQRLDEAEGRLHSIWMMYK